MSGPDNTLETINRAKEHPMLQALRRLYNVCMCVTQHNHTTGRRCLPACLPAMPLPFAYIFGMYVCVSFALIAQSRSSSGVVKEVGRACRAEQSHWDRIAQDGRPLLVCG